MKKCLLLFLLLPALAFAQTAAEMDILLETETVSTGTAARFALGAVGMMTPELTGVAAENAAYQEALSRAWVKSGQEEAINMQEMAFLIMNAFEIKGGIMYSLLHNPRYAYREMVYRKLILGRSDSNMKVSGMRFLQILGSTLNYTGEREEIDEMLQISGGSN